jgi:hypothetical protein
MRRQQRQICDKCGLSYRYAHDFEEHKRVGCRVESGKGPTWSDKDVEDVVEPVPEVAPPVVSPEPVVEEPVVEEPKKRKK